MSSLTGVSHRAALRLEYATIAWNAAEAAITIGLGIAAASLALVGFGSDSLIEIFASSVVVWHLRPGHEWSDPRRTAMALRLVGMAFAALAVVLAAAAFHDFVVGRHPEESAWGAVYLIAAAAAMGGLAIAKHRLAERLGSAPLRSEARLTMLDSGLAAGTAAGLGLNIFFGWWWADPLAAVVVASLCAREASENFREAREKAVSIAAE